MGLSNLFNNASIINSSSTSVEKYIGLPVLGSSIVQIEKKNSIVKYIEVDTTLFQNTENLIKPF